MRQPSFQVLVVDPGLMLTQVSAVDCPQRQLSAQPLRSMQSEAPSPHRSFWGGIWLQWNSFQSPLLNVNSRVNGRIARCKHNALLQGMLRCSACDCGMSHSFTKKGSRLYRYYICHKAQKQGWATCPSPSLPANEIEEFVVGQIRSLGEDPSVIRDTLAQTRIQTHQQSERLKQEKNALEGVIRGDYERLNVAVSAENGEAVIAKLQREIQDHERRLSAVTLDLKTVNALTITENEVSEALGNFDEIWNTLSPAERAKVMQQVVDHVSYDGHTNNLSITYQPIGIMTFGNEHAATEGTIEC